MEGCQLEVRWNASGCGFAVQPLRDVAAAATLVAVLRLRFPAPARVAVLLCVGGGNGTDRTGSFEEILSTLELVAGDVTVCRGSGSAVRSHGTSLALGLASAARRADVVVVCGAAAALSEAEDLIDAYVETSTSSSSRGSRVLIVDHDDSFTRNLVHMLEELGAVPTMVRAFGPRVDLGAFGSVVLSPGPGNPTVDADVGMSPGLLAAAGRTPVLGVCLGHQLLAHVNGAKVQRASCPMHGRASVVRLEPAGRADPLFEGLPCEFSVIRYHSLAVDDRSLPESLVALAFSAESGGSKTLMALRHASLPQWGVQYHPESICSSFGLRLLANFLDISRRAAVALAPSPSLLSGGDGAKRRRGAAAAAQQALGPSSPASGSAGRLRFSCRCLPEPACGREDAFFEAFARLARPRVLLESSRVITGFSRYSFAAGAPCLGPLSFSLAYHRSCGVARCRGPGAPFTERAVANRDGFFELVASLLPGQPVNSRAAFDFAGGLVGYIGYELRPHASAPASSDDDAPDACFLFVDRFLAYDHLTGETFACSLEPFAGASPAWASGAEAERMARGELPSEPPQEVPAPEMLRFSVAHSSEEYVDCVERCQELIRAGETYELCFTTRFEAAAAVEPLAVFRHLRRLNAAPYGFMYDFEEVSPSGQGLAVLGCSPERFLSVSRSGAVTSKPMKGTARRDLTDAARDDAVRRELAASEKDRAENLMIVDLVRHDLSAVCEPASVRCPQLMDVETFAAVHQMVSLVRGQLPTQRYSSCGERLVDAVQACFPAGSMTGAPKLRSMELLHELEHRQPRGIFSGASGYLSVSGAADLAVVIRSVVVHRGPQPRVTLGAGGAVTLLSEPEGELGEMMLKAERLLQALACYAPTFVEGRRGSFSSVAPPTGVAAVAPPRPEPVLLETMLWNVDGPGGALADEPYLWVLHAERLERGARALRLPLPPRQELLEACRAAVGAAASPQRVRVLLSVAGPRAEGAPVEVGSRFPLDLDSAPRLVCLDLQASVHSADPLLRHKTTWRSHYDQARQRVLGPGSDLFDVVMYNEIGEVTETSIANIAVEFHDGWRTPPVSSGVLPGVMRERMLATGELREASITVRQLVAAVAEGRRLLCFNSVRGAYLVQLVSEQHQGLRPS